MLAGKFSDRAVRVWDTRLGNELHSVTFPNHVDFPESFAFSPDGMTLALHLGDIVKRLDTNTWQLRALENRLPRELYCLTYAPDGQCLAIGSSKQIEFWDTATDEQTAILLGLDGDVKSSAFAPDGRTLASGSSTGELKLWDWATKQELLSLVGHTGSIDCIAFSPDGKTLASAGAKPDGRGEIRFWHTALALTHQGTYTR